ncbi:MAG: nucleotidyltransferase domain-containing protein [Rhodomicrobium sp.]
MNQLSGKKVQGLIADEITALSGKQATAIKWFCRCCEADRRLSPPSMVEGCHAAANNLVASMAPITNYGGYTTADQALDEVVHRLVGALNPVAIYLFGSRGRGTARPDSDFDLLAVTRPEDGEAGYDYARAYAPPAGRGIACDVLPVPAADFLEDKDDPTSLCFEAAHRGKKIYECG